MTALRMALSELRRLTSGRLPRAALLAMLVIPLLYGGLYLYANHDPYSRLDQVPAALVDEDAGTTDAHGDRQDVGAAVTRDLLRRGDFDWHRVSAAEADRGVREGRYDFALTLPRDLSASLASSTRLTDPGLAPRQGTLVLTTNDANNALARTISTQLAGTVRDTVAGQVGERAADGFLVGFATIHDQLGSAATGAHRLAEGAGGAAAGVARLAEGSSDLLTGQRRLATG
ncbi:YhgE/Pip domain-containing protein, partial [Angustibacter aerolatus]